MKRFHFEEVTSTNDIAKELIDEYEELIVTADHQTAGRGRNGRSWQGSKENNVYFSYGMQHRSGMNVDNIVLMQAAGAIAVKKTLEKFLPKNKLILKYPNDVLVLEDGSYKKISGVITEHAFQGDKCYSTIIGIGINTGESSFNPDLAETATSLKKLGKECEPEYIINHLIPELQMLLELNIINLKNIWKKTLNIEGKIVTLVNDDERYNIKEMNTNGTLRAVNIKTLNEITIDNGDSLRYEYG